MQVFPTISKRVNNLRQCVKLQIDDNNQICIERITAKLVFGSSGFQIFFYFLMTRLFEDLYYVFQNTQPR